MRRTIWGFPCTVAAGIVFSILSAVAGDRDDEYICDNHHSGAAGIAACTRAFTYENAIKANIYHNRALIYENMGEFDHAIADYSESIRLNPRTGCFACRGDLYRDKGDYDRAFADYNQAIRLNPKKASVYRSRGKAYSAKGDFDRALVDYTQAISLDPKNAYAYKNRAVAYKGKDDLDHAIADYGEAIRLDPNVGCFVCRGEAHSAKGDNDRAIADFNQAISLDPKNGYAYRSRGLAHLYNGALPKALADINQASALAPKDAYNALWVDIVGQRNNLPSRLPQTSSQVDMTTWPAPVVRLFMGQMTAEAALAAADDPDATKKKGQVCEANFYIGELLLLKGSKDEATRPFRLAASDCPHSFIEWNAANAELKALGAAP
jgi:lipoprotein NlpI